MFLSYLIPNWQVILLDFCLWLQSRSLSTRHPLSCIRAENCGLRAHQQKLPRNPGKLLPISLWWDPPYQRWAKNNKFRTIDPTYLSDFKILLWKLIWNLKSYVILNIVFILWDSMKDIDYYIETHLLRNPQWHLILYYHSKFR